MKKRRVTLFAGALLLAITPFLFANGTIKEATVAASDNGGIPLVGSYDNLKKLLQKEGANTMYLYGAPAMEGAVVTKQAAPQVRSGDSSGAGSEANYSTTNTQVQGVDEADIVKTDGTYLYQATNKEVRIIKAYPADKLAVESRITYEDGLFQPLEMFVDEKRLVVIGQAHQSTQAPAIPMSKRVIPHYHEKQTVKALIYDLADKKHPILTRQLEVEGQYLSSRKIGSNLYLTANNYVDTYRILAEKEEVPGPVYLDSAQGDEYKTIPYSDIRYFPESIHPDYLMVAGVNLDDAKKKMSMNTYLGAGENIYASKENLYVAVTEFNAVPVKVKPQESFAPKLIAPSVDSKTTVYRFAMDKGNLTFSGKGDVPGRILNQFSLDEHDGYLRVATTSGEMWRTDENTSKNNLYVLGKNLSVYGKLEGIAPGERIYSVRFIGDRAYMVTFKKVDPLFVLDLANPESPTILGALKIPGYSDYLHPYDENHIIGFGKEAESDKDWAYYQGMKVALFDVTDVTKPEEKFKTVIGDRGTDSELLSNHKALLFSKEKDLLAFPVTVYEWSDEQKAKKDIRDYGQFTFQGAYVYHLDLQKGFTLTSKITHLGQEEMKKAGEGWYQSEKNINRILTIDDTLYTVSDSYVKAQQLSTKRQMGTLPLTK
ncbi:beta-propeller domain-containing protein [Brevibacillus sp. NRS-1366]|uniref:beta-propeller domain-containing protein n=1 Tax=Brevibacillus sp. NRS-1366 TaxID=3233899 RepID=UPI003D223AF0